MVLLTSKRRKQMKRIVSISIFLLITSLGLISNAQSRIEIPFNKSWYFTGGSVTGETIDKLVNVPHTWNAKDAQEGIAYYRGTGTYVKAFTPDESWKEKRVFIRFEGVMTVAKVYLNDKLLGEHDGGFSAFIFELTGKLNFGQENRLKVVANNEFTLDVLPLFGDFNIYGGMYRPVNLIITSPVCISPLDFASPGIYLKQSYVSAELANVDVKIKLSNAKENTEPITVFTAITDAEGNTVENQSKKIEAASGESEVSQSFTIKQPKLWNGKKDAYLYQVTVSLEKNGVVFDSKTEPLGLRYFRVDPNEGFFLNGQHLPLHGVARHQDRQDKGNALSYSDHKQDMELMLEMGINALRLAHYQHSETIYDLADSSGLVVWAEMPWVGGPGGFTGNDTNGYENTEAFHNNAKQQLRELIRQNFNHPSICFWSIFNEIQNPKDESPVPFIKELNALAKTEDPSRLTVGASMLDPKEPIHDITDAIAWNRYFGWYYKNPEDIGSFLDKTHETYPNLCIGISEYGAGASIYQHSEKLKRPNPFGSPHPEEWQSYYHEQHLKVFNARPYVWGTFLWNMFDFGSQFRREGDHYGINDKGVVTFDRKHKKDAFFLYKANWSDEPVLHITSKRFIFRKNEQTKIKVYTNLPSVTLAVNGETIGTQTTEDGIVVWDNITLKKGNNGIVVTGEQNGKTLTDSCVWVLDSGFGMMQIIKIYDFLNYVPFALIAGLLLLIWLWIKGWRKKTGTAKWKRRMAKVFFFLILIIEILIIVFKILISSALG
jgi:beta-galactosidase